MNLTFMDLHLLAGADYVKSLEYSSELLRKISKIWEVLAWRNRYLSDDSNYRYNFAVPHGDPECHSPRAHQKSAQNRL